MHLVADIGYELYSAPDGLSIVQTSAQVIEHVCPASSHSWQAWSGREKSSSEHKLLSLLLSPFVPLGSPFCMQPDSQPGGRATHLLPDPRPLQHKPLSHHFGFSVPPQL